MIDLRAHIHDVQALENKAAEKAGMRFALLDESALLGRDNQGYIEGYIARLLQDMAPELEAAAKLGRQLNHELAK